MPKLTPDDAQARRHARLSNAIALSQHELDNLRAPNDEAPLTWADIADDWFDDAAKRVIEAEEEVHGRDAA